MDFVRAQLAHLVHQGLQRFNGDFPDGKPHDQGRQQCRAGGSQHGHIFGMCQTGIKRRHVSEGGDFEHRLGRRINIHRLIHRERAIHVFIRLRPAGGLVQHGAVGQAEFERKTREDRLRVGKVVQHVIGNLQIAVAGILSQRLNKFVAHFLANDAYCANGLETFGAYAARGLGAQVLARRLIRIDIQRFRQRAGDRIEIPVQRLKRDQV